MPEISKWFGRKFDLSFPVELYPNICARLRGTPARLEELVRDIPADAMTRRHGDTWSAQENVGHLLDLEILWLARLEDYVNGAKVLTEADLNNRKTHEANHNAHSLKEILSDFRKARTQLVKHAETFSPELYARTALHPRLKTPLRLVDHLYFVAEHDDHHLAGIWELANKR